MTITPKFSTILAALAVALALPAGAAAAVAISPIHEPFTPLPCTGAPSQRTTVQIEGCAEHQILRTDKRIDALNKGLMGNLGPAAQRRFVAGHKAWLAYRRAYCTSRADVSAGGTAVPVIAAQCAVSLNNQHLKDLRSFANELSAE